MSHMQRREVTIPREESSGLDGGVSVDACAVRHSLISPVPATVPPPNLSSIRFSYPKVSSFLSTISRLAVISPSCLSRSRMGLVRKRRSTPSALLRVHHSKND